MRPVHAEKETGDQGRWGSLSLGLNAFFVVLLMTASFTIGYLFDRGRAEAVTRRELEHLRLHAERGADELQRFVRQIRGDVLFLAGTPPVNVIRRALEANGFDEVRHSDLKQWETRLRQTLLSVAAARPEYFQLRLIGVRNNGREFVRIGRDDRGVRAVSDDQLQSKGGRYYFGEASRLEPGSVYLSRIDLNVEHHQISVPHQPTLRAATPVRDPAGNLFGVVVVNMAMDWVFERVAAFKDPSESLYVVDEQGRFLFHPEPGRAFSFELGSPYRLADAFPNQQKRLLRTLSDKKDFVELSGPRGKVFAYLTERAWNPGDPDRRLVFIMTKPVEQVLALDRLRPPGALLGAAILLSLAIVLVIVMVRRLTRSLTDLATASQAIGAGDYGAALPRGGGREIVSLVRAIRRMKTEIQKRETTLVELNWELERRVDERTAELARQTAFQGLILEHIADGIIVADSAGRFSLWNDKAARIVGSRPDSVPPECWSVHFGIFRDEGEEPVPVDELPLIRALRGESSDNVELYLRRQHDEEGRWVQMTARPLPGANEAITSVVAVLVDVSEHKRLRRRLEDDRAELARVGRVALGAGIASSAAHQLSQPIGAMSNYASAAVHLLAQGRLGEGEFLEVLTRIQILTEQAGDVLEKLRVLIRRRRNADVPVDVNAVTDACFDLFGERVRRQGVRIQRRYARDLPKPVCDPVELMHVLTQLVSNALEAMDDPAVRERCLSIDTDHDPEADLLRIAVRDTGPGVSPEKAENLFEPWQSEKSDALGIGLYVAQSILELRRGAIRLDSRYTDGALFLIELPVGSTRST